MVVNDHADCLVPRGVFESIASERLLQRICDVLQISCVIQ